MDLQVLEVVRGQSMTPALVRQAPGLTYRISNLFIHLEIT